MFLIFQINFANAQKRKEKGFVLRFKFCDIKPHQLITAVLPQAGVS